MTDLGSWVKASAHRFDEWEIDFPDSCQYRHIGREEGTSERTSPICIVVSDDMSPAGDAEIDAHANAIAALPDVLNALRMWMAMHSDPEFAAKPTLEQAEIRTVAWLNSVRAIARVEGQQ